MDDANLRTGGRTPVAVPPRDGSVCDLLFPGGELLPLAEFRGGWWAVQPPPHPLGVEHPVA